ncbi:hypothetical protein L2E82_24724 [Cichorium intybus]|uniref:Uncharacterized protein n=1 Tax=Cichorium intybus TaxID=13427 RepID=A0ACB9E2B3_CICIN|nr:hypothetical protein L2E82_24724 [Cichorium intybus]
MGEEQRRQAEYQIDLRNLTAFDLITGQGFYFYSANSSVKIGIHSSDKVISPTQLVLEELEVGGVSVAVALINGFDWINGACVRYPA